ncbi:MAG: lipoate--protein ligase family protein [Thermoplasmata archaeon]|nr:lipoate--protein ligase family protein [Thermoplasmata archaeon]
MIWRLIDTDLAHPYYVTAADEAILEAFRKNIIPPTIHFYRRKPAGVSVGRTKKIEGDVNIKKCEKYGVKVVRRKSGGGTIYTDEGCLIYSITFSPGLETYDPLKIFQKTCSSIICALQRFHINAEYKTPNDILVNGKKISGSAQVRKGDSVLIHGTILVSTNLDVMREVLKKHKPVSTLEIESKGELPLIGEIKKALADEFGKTFGVRLEKNDFTKYEKKLIEKLVQERYGRDEWNFKI